ncbi:MAG: ankyrin repeat domain-containing protein [Alphaproteobacteria bacterium]|nr:ankyrin repeat domain-containing protein [Alphaproteobacteria bacterium]
MRYQRRDATGGPFWEKIRAEMRNGEALCENVAKGDSDHISTLLELDIYETDKRKALGIAVQKKRGRILEKLLQHGIKPDIYIGDTTPLHMAVEGGSRKITGILLEGGADRAAKDSHGQTAEEKARANGKNRLAKFIADFMPAEETRKYKLGNKLNSAIYWNRKIKAFELIQQGANVNIKNAFNLAPLHRVAADTSGWEHIAELLLEKGADIDAHTNDGSTALHFAAQSKNIDIAMVLLKAGADKTIRDNGGRLALDYTSPNSDLARLLQPDPAPEDTTTTKIKEQNEWLRIDEHTIAHIETMPALQRQITSLFNFESAERREISLNLATKAEAIATTSFEYISPAALETAAQHFEKIAGQKPPAYSTKLGTMRTYTLKPRPQAKGAHNET